MLRANNFNDPIVENILLIGYADYNPFTQKPMVGRYAYSLDYFDEKPIDSMTLDAYIVLINSMKNELYDKFFNDTTYLDRFCFEVSAYGSFYELRLVVLTDDLDEFLDEIAIDVYDEDEDIDDEEELEDEDN